MPGKPTKLTELTGKRLQRFMQHQRQNGFHLNVRQLAKILDVGEARCLTWVNGRTELPPFYASTLREKFGLTMDFTYSLDEERMIPEYWPIHNPYKPD